jgi:hypothetical protein
LTVRYGYTLTHHTKVTVQQFGYGTTGARDISKVGMEQCLDMMAAMFHSS